MFRSQCVVTSFSAFVFLIIQCFVLNTSALANETSDKVVDRIRDEKRIEKVPFSIAPHKPMYFLPISYNFSEMNSATQDNENVDDLEAKFQLSFKISIIDSFLKNRASLQFGYTQTAFWQVYNKKASAPFRESNYEPEVFLVYNPKGLEETHWYSSYLFGFAHQSNGRSTDVSRSWNRVYVQKYWDLDYLVVSTKAWYRIPEKEKEDPQQAEGDDNPQINHYMGFAEVLLLKQLGNHTFSLLLRNNLKSTNRGALQFSWSRPIDDKYQFYFQYFNGYGESLIDYDINSDRISVGLIVNDWI